MSRVRARARLVCALTFVSAVACSGGAPAARAPVTLAGFYRVVYRVTQNGAPHWEVLTVRRPFDASDLTYDSPGPPRPGDVAASGNISTELALYAVDGPSVRLVSGRQPGPASGDQYLATGLADLVARKLAVDTGTRRRIATRACRVYRFAEPPSGPVRPLNGGSDHDDLCLDSAGLVLSERWTYHGAVVLGRAATDVLTPVSGEVPVAPAPAGATLAGAAAPTATPDPGAKTFLAAPPAPSGYSPSGPPVAFRLPDPRTPTATAAASIVWAFVDGARVVTVEAGTGRPGQLPWRLDDTVTKPATLHGLGPATTAVRSDGTEVRVDVSGGRWVRVRGTVRATDLVAYAQQLTLTADAPSGR